MTTQKKVEIPVLKLNSGFEIPALGYGTWLGFTSKGKFAYEEIPRLKAALKHAIGCGYRHIDTAHLYRVESAIGEVVRELVASGDIRREDLFITTKVWNHMHAPADVQRSLRDSLARLQTGYVDLALVHWPMSVTVDGKDAKIDYLETWKGMEAAQRAGLARSIGVSNFNVDQMKRLLANCEIKPAMNQVELNLNLGQKELVDFCQAQGVALTAYTPFGTLLASRNLPGSPEPNTDTPLMLELASKYSKTPTQIALRYLYQRGLCAIPKSVTEQRIKENASIFDFSLTPEDSAKLAEYDIGYRTIRPSFWQNYENYPFDKVKLEKEEPIPEALLKWEEM